MFSVYTEKSYRKILRSRVDALKKNKDVTFAKVASKARIPSSYLSKVVNGFVDLNGDQLYRVAKCLDFTGDEIEYLQLLLDRERSSDKERKKVLDHKIENLRARKLDVTTHLDKKDFSLSNPALAEYYWNPINQIVHIALTIKKYGQNPSLLNEDLGLSVERLSKSIEVLLRLGFIERLGSQFKVKVFDINLSREHPVYETWRDQIRLLSLARLRQLNQNQSYSFSAVFNADEEVRLVIQAKFLQFLDDVSGLVKKAKDEKCYQINFDIFGWTQ